MNHEYSNKKAMALHDLICRMLRGGHVSNIKPDSLKNYIYEAGVALHNIPLVISSGGSLSDHQLNQINALDPSAKTGQWGDWCKLITDSFEQELPSATPYLEKNYFPKSSELFQLNGSLNRIKGFTLSLFFLALMIVTLYVSFHLAEMASEFFIGNNPFPFEKVIFQALCFLSIAVIPLYYLGRLQSFYIGRFWEKYGTKVQSVAVLDKPGSYRFNPVEGKSAEEIISWFQKVVDVELNQQNYTLALDAINSHLINNSAPSVKSILDVLEFIAPLNAFSIELKQNLLYTVK